MNDELRYRILSAVRDYPDEQKVGITVGVLRELLLLLAESVSADEAYRQGYEEGLYDGAQSEAVA